MVDYGTILQLTFTYIPDFSRATSKGLTPRLLAAWARIKGIDVIGTGDFTHPEWLQEIEELLVEDGFWVYFHSGLRKGLKTKSTG